jgi:DNA-binding NarL/FixJ family response regulator
MTIHLKLWPMLNIAIAEDQTLFRKGMIALLNAFKNTRVCVEASDGADMLEQLAHAKVPIDVALIDINMPQINGIELLKRIRKLYPRIKNIILSYHKEEKFIHKLIKEGANAYLVKNSEPAEVEKAIHTVVTKDYYFNDKVTNAMHDYMFRKKKKTAHHPHAELTSREQEVLKLICQELTSLEISKKLFISESTVNGHRNNLLLKIGCRNTSGLVLYAVKNELIDIG